MNDATFRQSAGPAVRHAIRAAHSRLETGTNSARQARVCTPPCAPALPRSRQTIGTDNGSDRRGAARGRPCVDHERWRCFRSPTSPTSASSDPAARTLALTRRIDPRAHVSLPARRRGQSASSRPRARWLASTKRTRPALARTRAVAINAAQATGSAPPFRTKRCAATISAWPAPGPRYRCRTSPATRLLAAMPARRRMHVWIRTRAPVSQIASLAHPRKVGRSVVRTTD